MWPVIADDVGRDSLRRRVSPRLACGELLSDGQQGGAGALVDRPPAGDSSAAGPATLCSAFAACAGKGNDARASAPWSIEWPVALIRFAVAVLLLTSAILKAVSPAESAALATGYSIPPWLTVAAVQLELLVAAALVFGCWQWWTLRLTGGLFSVFAALSLYRAVAGFESCGCFGAVKVNPWITFVLDLVVLGCLGFAVKRSGKADQQRDDARQVRWAAAAYVLFGPLMLVLMLWTGPTTLGSNGSLVQSGEFVILDPESWVNKEFPLTAYLSPQVDVTRGDWTVFIYHRDCPKCEDAIPKYLALAERLSRQGRGERVLFLEVPPYGAALPRRRSVHYARLEDEHEWFVQAPVAIVLTNGVATSIQLNHPEPEERRIRKPKERLTRRGSRS